MKKILVIGELLWDLLPDGRKLGGAPANFTFRLNSMGYDARLVSSVGNDSLGKEAIQILEEQGVNTAFIQVNKNYPTGTVNVFFDSVKNPDYIINPNAAYDFISIDDEIIDFAREADCIAYGTLVQRSEQSRSAIGEIIKAGEKAIKFLDINLRKNCFSEKTVKYSLDHADILKMNRDETFETSHMSGLKADGLPTVGRELVKKYKLKICLITLEEYGALIISDNNDIIYNPGYKVKMEDPLGAGDAFSAAFVHSLLENNTLNTSLEAGNKAGAIVVAQKGAMQEISVQDIKAFNEEPPERIFDNQYLSFMSTSI